MLKVKHIMQFVNEFRDADLVQGVIEEIRRTVTRPWVLMEICGGQTHAIMRYGLDQLLPPEIELVHGPGCPVCVTPLELIDKALAIASQPGCHLHLLWRYAARARLAARPVLRPRARRAGAGGLFPAGCGQDRPAEPRQAGGLLRHWLRNHRAHNAMSVLQAQALGLKNFSVLVSQVCVPPAMHAILGSPHNRVQGFLAAGHVCAVMGYWEYPPIAEQYGVPIAVTGFEPLDLVQGILMTVQMLEAGRSRREERLSARGDL